MIFINKAAVNAGQIQGNTNLPGVSNLNALQALRYTSNSEVFVNTTNTPAPTDQYTQGCRFAPNGAVYVRPVETLGVPANIDYDGGMALDGTTNALLITTASVARYVNGWPLDQRGFVCMNVNAVPPPVPGAFTFTVTGGAQNPSPVLNWTASPNATSYTIYRDGVLQSTVAAPTTTFQQTLPIGDNYSYTMFAVNVVGDTVASSNNPQPYSYQSLPGPPTNVTAVSGALSATVTFSPPLKNGNTGVFGYTATANTGQFAQGAGPSIVVVGLVSGQTYTFTVTAINSIGSGPPSAPSNSIVAT